MSAARVAPAALGGSFAAPKSRSHGVRRASALSSTTASSTLPDLHEHLSCFQRVRKYLVEALHISYSGTYSVERMLAMEEYAAAPWWRVAAVCTLSPLPTLVFVIAMETLPLQNPYSGWRRNYGFLVRHFILTVVSMECNALQMKKLVPDLPWRRRRVLALSVMTGVLSVLGTILVGQLWVFPIPFFMLIIGIPFTSIWVKAFERMVMAELPTLAPDFLTRYKRASDVFNVQGALVSVYPIYNAIFVTLPTHFQPLFVCVLPVIKTILKKKMAGKLQDLEDYLPEEAIFTVELFNALYSASCMQNTGTPVTTAVILGFDAMSSLHSLRGIHLRTNVLRSLHKQHVAAFALTDTGEKKSLRQLVLDLLKEPETIDKSVLMRVRVESCITHLLAPAHRKTVEALVRTRERLPTAVRIAPAPVATSRRWSLATPPSLIQPAEEQLFQPPPLTQHQSSTQKLAISQRQKSHLMFQTLRAYFNIEYLVLTEYVECVIPVMYAIYLPVLVMLPNNGFYPHARRLRDDPDRLQAVVVNILLFAGLEVLSLVALSWILRRSFGFSPFHQLAFVLEKQSALVHTKFVVWLIYALQFTLDHQGADFSFQFEWLK